MQATKLEAPKCSVCGEPMSHVKTIEAVKDGSKVLIRVFTCFQHKMFEKLEEVMSDASS